MNKPQHLVLAILAIVAALGAVGIVVSATISSPIEAQAASCVQEIAGCHGCSLSSQGIVASEGKCFNRG